MNPTKQLVEAAKAVLNRNKPVDQIYRDLDKLQEAITAYEQSESSSRQQENDESDKTKTGIWRKWDSKPDLSYNEAAYGAMLEYASQQTALKDKQLQVQQSHIDDQDQLIFEQDKEITELKEAISELIQVKDWKDKHGKDEHYLKAMPIAWENVRKLIQK